MLFKISTTGGIWENNGRSCVFLPATAKPTVFGSQSGYDSEMRSVAPPGFYANRSGGRQMKKGAERKKPWLWHAELVLILSNPGICWATPLLGWLGFLCALCAFTCPLRKSSSSFPPAHLYPSLLLLSPSSSSPSTSSSCLSLPCFRVSSPLTRQ